MRSLLYGLLLTTAVPPLGAQRPAQPPPPPPVSRQAMLVAEDNRIVTETALAPLNAALAHRDPTTAARALQAFGRLENAKLLPRLLPFLADARPVVRAAAAFALGQIGQDTAAVPAIAPLLVDRLAEEPDPVVLGAVARSVARLAFRDVDRATGARRALLAVADRTLPAQPPIEVARALESFARLNGRLSGPSPELLARLRAFAVYTAADAEAAGKVRRAAMAALVRVAEPDDALLVRLAGDPVDEVRRLAVIWAGDSVDVESRREYLAGALIDRSPAVRLEAIRVWARRFQASDCQPLVRALRDRAFAVALESIDRLAPTCPDVVAVGETLWQLVDSLVGAQRNDFTGIAAWHRGAHALLALARLDPPRAKAVLSRAGASATWQVRMYAARAAAIVGDPERLLTLSDDPNDNVREAAVQGLVKVRGHGADSVYRAALARPDYQLVIAAAQALTGTPERVRAAVALQNALARISTERKETSRDPRLAILDRLVEVGGIDDTLGLEPLLADFDPVVAHRAAGLLSTLSGRPRVAAPAPLSPPVLDQEAIDRLRGSRLRVTLSPTAGGGHFDILLYPDLAPATVARIVARAEAGYYDALTFHRVEPNFVLQGGSPRANEYAGDSRYLRDEISPVSHERGTMGISTRGRDTGDAQFFVNLVDNLRLDFHYTVWGRIVNGMDVVDAILEGDVIDRIDLVDAGASGSQP